MSKYLYILFIIFLFSCEKELAVDLPPHEEKLVVNSLVLSGAPIVVYLSSSKTMQDTLLPLGNDALTIIKQGEITDTLKYIGNGAFRTKNMIAEQEKSYSIEIQSNQYNHIYAHDLIPKQASFELIDFKAKTRIDTEGYEYSEFEISFDDDISVSNYYEISLVSYGEFGLHKSYLLSDDAYVLNENDAEFYPYNILLSDELFNGENVTINLYMQYQESDTEYYIYFRGISETYYKYKKKLIRHIDNQYSDIWYGSGNPVNLFSNIENGYGIFAGYSEQVDTIRIAEWEK